MMPFPSPDTKVSLVEQSPRMADHSARRIVLSGGIGGNGFTYNQRFQKRNADTGVAEHGRPARNPSIDGGNRTKPDPASITRRELPDWYRWVTAGIAISTIVILLIIRHTLGG